MLCGPRRTDGPPLTDLLVRSVVHTRSEASPSSAESAGGSPSSGGRKVYVGANRYRSNEEKSSESWRKYNLAQGYHNQ